MLKSKHTLVHLTWISLVLLIALAACVSGEYVPDEDYEGSDGDSDGDSDADADADADADSDADSDSDSDADADADADSDTDSDADCPDECALEQYTACTCDPSDPCGWGSDGICDELSCEESFGYSFYDGTDCDGTPCTTEEYLCTGLYELSYCNGTFWEVHDCDTVCVDAGYLFSTGCDYDLTLLHDVCFCT